MFNLWNTFINGNKASTNKLVDNGIPESTAYSGSYASTSPDFIGINEKSVMKIPAFRIGMNIITGAIASFLLVLKKNDADSVPDLIKGDYRLGILNSEPNNTMTGVEFKTVLVKNLLLHGNAIIYIKRDTNNSNKIIGLYILSNDQVQIQSYINKNDGISHFGTYTYTNNAGSTIFTDGDNNIINISINSDDGVIGRGLLEDGRDVLELALQESKYESSLLSNGAVPSAIVSIGNPLQSKAFDKYKDLFNNAYQGIAKAGKTLFLQGDVKYQKITADPSSMQLDANAARTTSNIARLLNIPEVLINASANKYDSTEENNLQFYQYCLRPILSAIESSFNKFLLLESEKKDGYFFQFDNNTLMQNTLAEKVQSWGKAFNNGVIQYDEYRQKLGLQPENKDHDFSMPSIGRALYYPDKQIMIIPNTGTILNTETGEIIQKGVVNNGVKQENNTDSDNDFNKDDDDSIS